MVPSSRSKTTASTDQISVAAGRVPPERRDRARTGALRLTAVIIVIVSLGLLAGSAKATTTPAPTVTGTAQVNQTLTATQVDPLNPVVWYTCDAGGNISAGSTPLPGSAVSPYTYQTQESDLATYVCATQDNELFVSAPVGPITDPGIVEPTISGSFVDGQTLTASQASWTDTPASIDYQWVYDCGGDACPTIPGATTDQYTLSGNAGQNVEVLETPVYGSTAAVNATVISSAGDTVTAPSTPAPAPAPAPAPTPKNASAPSISGTAQLGQTLTAVPGKTSTTATGYTYQWLRCTLNCTAISGAVGATYGLGNSEVGDTIAVTVTTQSASGATAATSPRTGTVTAPSTLQIVASPSRPLVNQPVTIVGVVTSTAEGTDPSGTVAFADDGSPIAGCAAVTVPATSQTVTVSCTTSFPVSSPSLSATFSPAAGSPVLGSAATTTALSVGRGYSTTSLDVPAKARRGTSTTYTASIAAGRDLIGPVLPAGTVSFLDHGQAIPGCGAVRISDGGATCTVRNSHTGTQAISARYGGDADFRGSSSSVKAVKVTVAPSRRTKVLGSVTATMQWTFHYTPSYTRIIALVLHGANAGATVTIDCTGKGCPFETRAHAVLKQKRCRSSRKHTCPAPGTIGLEPSFRHHDLRSHAQVTITVTQKRYVGKYYRFTMRARRPPSVKISCLAVGSSKPGVGCTAP